MNEVKLLYNCIRKIRPIKYNFETRQYIELFLNNLTSDQKEIFYEFMDKIHKEREKAEYIWYCRGISSAKRFRD
ncbi:MAG: hypothetical protein N2749_02670 [Clostridia bacterium]|nr:hypothetical protein [Clostridia bacterium]